ncbi:MAG TPA: CAP domain-containing protein [Solirubrobacterales bacterium]|nr:CAP domain-containing protein [Solirubrobacterales bacterium]
MARRRDIRWRGRTGQAICVGLLIGFFLAAFAPRASALDETDWLGRINEVRAASGVAPVADEPVWSAGILAHLEYEAKTPSSYFTGEYQSAHTENPASPYYTEAGAKEAASSDLGNGATNVAAIDQWLGAPFHAIGMLRPTLTKVAFARNAGGGAGLDVISGLGDWWSATPQQILFPGPGSTIDLSRFLGELPTPIETCEAQHPGADYDSPSLPLIALLTESPSAELSATLTRPDGSKVASTGPDLCVVTEHDFVTTDSIYGPTGRSILSSDRAVFVIAREPLVEGTYSVDIAQPGRPDVAWSFQSRPPPEPVTRSIGLRILVHGSTARIHPTGPYKAFLGKPVKVTLRRQWVPCALILHASRCTWVPKGRPEYRHLRFSRSMTVRFRRPGAWEKLGIDVRAPELVIGLTTYTPPMASTTLIGPKPRHAAR